MASIFENRPGRAVAVTDTDDTPLALRLDAWGGYAGFKAIITEVAVGLDGNYQFLHTLKDKIYIYVFGDRISQIRIAGLAFADTCPGGGPSGFELVLGFYQANRVANRATPSQIQIGTSAAGHFQGYLTNFKGDVFKPEARVTQFGLIYHVFPESS